MEDLGLSRSWLEEEGRQYKDQKANRVHILGKYFFDKDTGELRPAMVDQVTLKQTGGILALDLDTQDKLIKLGGNSLLNDGEGPYDKMIHLLKEQFSKEGLIVGFFGYARADNNYAKESEIIETFLSLCKEKNLPVALVVDGGTSTGTPGLSGVISRQQGIATLGVLPLGGLGILAPHTLTLVIGRQFGEEATIVANCADIYIILGGGEITRKEYKIALDAKTKIIVIQSKNDNNPESIFNHYEKIPGTKEAKENGQVLFYNDVSQLEEFLDNLNEAQWQTWRDRRQIRLANIAAYLTKLQSQTLIDTGDS